MAGGLLLLGVAIFLLLVALDCLSQGFIQNEIQHSHVCVATANFWATGLLPPLMLGFHHANNGHTFYFSLVSSFATPVSFGLLESKSLKHVLPSHSQ